MPDTGGATWNATKLSADAAKGFQIDSGVLLNKFNVTDPKEPADADIICATSGDIAIKVKPDIQDFFEDVNGADTGYIEGMEIKKWDSELSLTCLSITEETIKLAIGAAEKGEDGGIRPRSNYKPEDFKPIYWIGNMKESTDLIVAAMDHAISTEGLDFTATKKEKGKLALTFKAVASLKDKGKNPIAFYLLKKASGAPASMTAADETV